ncbi:YfiT family bacillithiol transferase [Brevibacillus panacihumi]|uniref:Putative metal-dependent hydrolase n=1 Tax=Brevibacillus panacihumi TaxID=497735 RepID=A0A3M8C2N5_9BACL|nr:putative metal-dependent hydrolase [Brevibacillus panacihumi]RNB69627.1 putative metal-dependent hydrolase [Brevibacillus panacihumi]
MEELRYPIGTFQRQDSLDEETRANFIAVLEAAPVKLSEAVSDLTNEQLDTPYRPDGWTVRQVVHHLADANLNFFFRTKLALTETEPVVKPFDEEGWAELPDSKVLPIDASLALIEQLNRRLVFLLRSTPVADFARTYRHPVNGVWTLDAALSFAAWHNLHHTAHITTLRERKNW